MKKGFTLIELLVVIAVIAVLAAFLFPAVSATMRNAKKAKASTEAKSIETALLSFYNDYGYFPYKFAENDDYGTRGMDNESDSKLGISLTNKFLDVMSGQSYQLGGGTVLNPRRIVYMEFSEKFVDPWRRGYRYMCDYNYDGSVTITGTSVSTNLPGRRVVVWSLGEDGLGNLEDNNHNNDDDIKTW